MLKTDMPSSYKLTRFGIKRKNETLSGAVRVLTTLITDRGPAVNTIWYHVNHGELYTVSEVLNNNVIFVTQSPISIESFVKLVEYGEFTLVGVSTKTTFVA